jgi:hypothetical protein
MLSQLHLAEKLITVIMFNQLLPTKKSLFDTHTSHILHPVIIINSMFLSHEALGQIYQKDWDLVSVSVMEYVEYLLAAFTITPRARLS